MNVASPVEVSKNQIFKYHFLSSFSLSNGVNVSTYFKISAFQVSTKIIS